MQLRTELEARTRLREVARGARAKLGICPGSGWREMARQIRATMGLEVRILGLHNDEGLYVPRRAGGERPVIALDPSRGGAERLSFTLSHELMHHLIREDVPLLSFLTEYSPSDASWNATLERYCDMGAGELLIPLEVVSQAIREYGFSIGLVEHLESQCSASKPAIALQLAECARHPCYVVVGEFIAMPPEPSGQLGIGALRSPAGPRLYTTYAFASPLCKYHIASHVPIARDHLMAEVYRERTSLRGVANIPFRSGREWATDCDAMFYKGKVYAAFNLTPPDGPFQLALC